MCFHGSMVGLVESGCMFGILATIYNGKDACIIEWKISELRHVPINERRRDSPPEQSHVSY